MEIVEKPSDADALREMITFAAEMQLSLVGLRPARIGRFAACRSRGDAAQEQLLDPGTMSRRADCPRCILRLGYVRSTPDCRQMQLKQLVTRGSLSTRRHA